MTRFSILSLSAVLALSAFAGETIDSIPYKVEYKWGFIQKTAGNGLVTLKNSGDTITATLSGQSVPWSGRLYTVTDTLKATVTHKDGQPVPQETVIYENGRYSKPLVTVNPDGSYNVQHTTLYKNIDGSGQLSASPETMEAVTITADMLGMFRYSREIDFSTMQPGQTVNVNISGEMPGQLSIEYLGQSTFMIGDRPIPAYQVKFDYAYQGKMSNYDVNCWIGVDQKFPIAFAADLLIGHVEMIWNP